MKTIAAEWIRTMEERRPLPALSPKRVTDSALDAQIASLPLEQLAESRTGALALKAGLHLWNGSLDRSHTIAQDIETATGSYWHGIMHRMEGDYGNAKYWFRLVGSHPAMAGLPEALRGALREAEADGASPALRGNAAGERLLAVADKPAWDPYGFIDAVMAAERGQGSEAVRLLLETVQHAELALLAAYSANQAE